MITIKLLDRYIGRNVFFSTLLVLFLLFMLLSFTVFVDGMSDLGHGRYGIMDLLRYTMLSQPKGIYQLFPTAALLGTTMGLSYLATNSELIAFRAAGISLWRIAWAVIKTGAIFVIAGSIIGEYVAPVAEEQAQRGRAEALGIGFRNQSTGLWLRSDLEYINVIEVLPDTSLRNINISRFDDNRNLQQLIYAKRGSYINGQWQLRKVKQTTFTESGIKITNLKTWDWSSGITPEEMAVFMVKPEALSFMRLYYYLEHLRANGQQTDRYELVFWRKLLSPFTIVVMLLLAIPFAFGQNRTGSLGKQMFMGLMLALAFNMADYGLGHSATLFGFSPLLGAALPLVLFSVLAAFLIRRAS
ncbi:MAG: LPS export ABC transporter permease LptG [Gammaproteobacteria bacterium]|nr:LPS export ABC transporter permease LptG [Gammaproteobacteria bacterium]